MKPQSERTRKYRQANREKYLASSRRYNNQYYQVRKLKDLCKKYNITIEQYFQMYEKYEGKCHICKLPESRKGFTSLCVDHCHTTSKVRGLLCNACNVGLGCFKDNVELLDKAKDYLSL